MTRSRRRKLKRIQSTIRSSVLRSGIPVASAILAAMHPALADEAADVGSLQEVVVTAQKVTENLQNVPLAVEVLDTAKIEQLNIANLDAYVEYSPSVSEVKSIGQGGNGQPGNSHVYIRGVVSGGEGNHSGPQPSVGTYFDEAPVTTIDGTVDVHIYDVQRIEVLEGPQGTLYGASSEAGTIRIISNKPDPTKFSAGYDVDLDQIERGGSDGWELQGFVNIPLSSIAAVRLVGWDEHDGGFISNVAGTNAGACIVNGVRTFPNWSGQEPGYNPDYSSTGPYKASPCPTPGVIGAGAISNAAYVKQDYNTVDTRGGRGALKLDLGDDWTVTPSFMGQSLTTEGFFGYDPAVGFLQVAHFGPENTQDTWTQTALTIEGRFSNFDLVYAGAYMKRDTHSLADYSDYSEFYDRSYGSGVNWIGNNGLPIMPLELVNTIGYFEKWSHELRLSTPAELPVRATVGLFIERQLHDIWEQYIMPGFDFTNPYGGNPNGFASSLSIPGRDNTIWLTDEQRVDRDKAAFIQATWDITSKLAVNGGFRYFQYDNSLEGFYGYSANYDALSGFTAGMVDCFMGPTTPGAPCTNLDNEVKATGSVPRANVTYKFTPDVMTYATFSRGFRPGGVNRTTQKGVGPYQADYLTNYEIGWKTQWFDQRVRWNGAFFWEDWKNFQFSFLGPNSLNIIENGGNARIKGVENEIEWVPTRELNLSASFTFLQAQLTENYCGEEGVTSCPGLVTPEPFLPGNELIGPQAPTGTDLPITPKFKGDLIARYNFNTVDGWAPYGQASWIYQSQTTPLLRVDEAEIDGTMPAYGLVNVAAGIVREGLTVQLSVTNLGDARAQMSRFTQTNPVVAPQPYIIPTQPRTFYVKLAQRF
jgi:iron complex outermembrane recepter protein